MLASSPTRSPRFQKKHACQLCGEAFRMSMLALTSGRHHCRACGLSVCGAHFSRPHCVLCVEEPHGSVGSAARVQRAPRLEVRKGASRRIFARGPRRAAEATASFQAAEEAP